MAELTPDQARLLEEPNVGVLATIRRDGTPHATPIWVDWDGERVVFNTAVGRAKERHMRRDPRVGGGYTGLWTALALHERDPALRIAVLEQGICGGGPSGRNGGFLHGYWSSLAGLTELFGRNDALRLCRASAEIMPAVRAFVAARRADVWLREGGLLKVATTAAQEASIDAAVAAAQAAGVAEEAVPLSRVEVAERCRSPLFRHGVLFRDGATVHPARLARAL